MLLWEMFWIPKVASYVINILSFILMNQSNMLKLTVKRFASHMCVLVGRTAVGFYLSQAEIDLFRTNEWIIPWIILRPNTYKL